MGGAPEAVLRVEMGPEAPVFQVLCKGTIVARKPCTSTLRAQSVTCGCKRRVSVCFTGKVTEKRAATEGRSRATPVANLPPK